MNKAKMIVEEENGNYKTAISGDREVIIDMLSSLVVSVCEASDIRPVNLLNMIAGNIEEESIPLFENDVDIGIPTSISDGKVHISMSGDENEIIDCITGTMKAVSERLRVDPRYLMGFIWKEIKDEMLFDEKIDERMLS